jgi:cytoskeletal protein RodZ
MADESGQQAAIAAAKAARRAKTGEKAVRPKHSLKQGVAVTPRGTQVIPEGAPVSSRRNHAPSSRRARSKKQKPYVLGGIVLGLVGLTTGVLIAQFLSARAETPRHTSDDDPQVVAEAATSKAKLAEELTRATPTATASASATPSASASVSATQAAAPPPPPFTHAPARHWRPPPPPPPREPPGFKDRGF